ncbi:MAG: NAD-dependent epimerase/dehydratase family protein [Rhodospirillaceae bacterium]
MTRVLVTGATGFIGRALMPQLLDRGWKVRAALRISDSTLPDGVELVTVGDVADLPDWRPALKEVDLVVHLAARVHVMADSAPDALARYRRINVDATRQLAEMARNAGVRRFLLMSSTKAAGEGGPNPLTEEMPPNPTDPYGISKLEAEAALREAANGKLASGKLANGNLAGNSMTWVALRPPLVYGPGVGANFLKLLGLARHGMPLPLGAVRNRRSLIYVGNLVDAVIHCLVHPDAANHSFFIHDGEPLSVPELINRLARLYGQPPLRQVAIPVPLLRLGAAMLGMSTTCDRLCGSLEVDDSALRRATNWSPRFTIDEGLRAVVNWDLARLNTNGL